MSFGIVIIATGHKGFGVLAHNLRVSLKALMPDISVTLLRDAGMPYDLYWDEMRELPTGINAFQLKTDIYNYTPYKRTLYIDADSLIIRDIRPEIESLKGAPIQFMEYRRYQKQDRSRMVWSDLPTLWNHYGLKDDAILPEYNSSIFYFEKCTPAKKFFSEAEKAYGQNVKLKEYVRREFPDEVAFSVASAKTGTLGIKPGWQPAYLEWPTDSGLAVKDIRANYYMVTMSGKSVPTGNTAHVYNGLGNQFSKQTGLPFTTWTKALKPS